MHHFQYRGDQFTCEEVPIERIAQEVGAPFYLYSHATLTHHFRVFDEAFADIPSFIALNRTLYERARDMGGTRLTSSAIPFTQADWIRHYGPAWEPFRAAKQRYDPKNVLTPGHNMFSG